MKRIGFWETTRSQRIFLIHYALHTHTHIYTNNFLLYDFIPSKRKFSMFCVLVLRALVACGNNNETAH